MKKLHITIFSILLISISTTIVSGQGFQPPALGKSVVYFARLNVMGFLIPFDFFNNDKFIGSFSGRGYFRYECDPGNQLFWASSENTAFLPADLQPDAIYVVIVDVKTGIAVARVGLRPVDAMDSAIPKVEELAFKKSSSNYSTSQLAEKTKELSEQIKSQLKKYEKLKAKGKYIQQLTPDMAVRVLIKNP